MKMMTLIPIVFLTACNYMAIKPGTMDPNSNIYIRRGGGLINLGVKETLEESGHTISAGKIRANRILDDESGLSDDYARIPSNVNYVVTIKERGQSFQPLWCFFNGFWWLKYDMSIIDNRDGRELLLWTGMGCLNSTMRKWNRALNGLEKK